MEIPAKTRSGRRPAAPRKRVLCVDPFPIVRAALSDWINRTPDLVLCGTAGTEASALTAVAQLEPDVVVTEILDQQDLGLIRHLRGRHPPLPILVFSFRDEGWYAPRALEAGANGYLTKGTSVDGLLRAIRQVLEGRVVLSRELRSQPLPKGLHRSTGFRPRSFRLCNPSPVEHC
jgi:DNA-binding NarL/FixJ family response regulator